MPIRGPFVIPRQSAFLWHLQGLYHFRWRHDFPGAYTQHNRKPKPGKRRIILR